MGRPKTKKVEQEIIEAPVFQKALPPEVVKKAEGAKVREEIYNGMRIIHH